MQPLRFSKHLTEAGIARSSNGSLLREPAGTENPLDFDQFQRYSHVANLLDRMLRLVPWADSDSRSWLQYPRSLAAVSRPEPCRGN